MHKTDDRQTQGSTEKAEQKTTTPTGARTSRRQVLQAAAGAGLLLTLPAAVRSASAEQWVAAGKSADFVKGRPVRVEVQGYVFYITRTDPKSLTAVWAKCTHMGCTVAWKPDTTLYACPCHGAQFDASGANLHGPSGNPSQKLKPLAVIPVRDNNGQVELNLAPQS